MLPLFTSQNLAISDASVVFPPPDGPTNAICSPAFISSEIPSTALVFASSYENLTFLSETDASLILLSEVPFGSSFTSSISSILFSASSTIICDSPAYATFISVVVSVAVIRI